MRKKKKRKAKKKKTRIKVIPAPKSIRLTRLNQKRLRENLTHEEWRLFKVWCIEHDIYMYKQLAKLVKRFLKQEKLI